MTKPSVPYLLFHPKFISKVGHGRQKAERWEFQATRTSLAKRWWAAGCFAIDDEMRRFELIDVHIKGVAWTWINIFQPSEKTFLAFEHIFDDEFQQLTFDEARGVYLDAMTPKRWWTSSGENEQEFRARVASYTNWSEVIEPLSLAGRYP